uniref:40S ribosomal protein S15a n=1 Tax=Eptatretus burgeri TaxID=7764 RepID=A0A8C4QTX6_EPTBU
MSQSVNERVCEIVDDHRAGKVVVILTGRWSKCGVISPRFGVQLKDLGKWPRNLLGLVVSTSAERKRLFSFLHFFFFHIDA